MVLGPFLHFPLPNHHCELNFTLSSVDFTSEMSLKHIHSFPLLLISFSPFYLSLGYHNNLAALCLASIFSFSPWHKPTLLMAVSVQTVSIIQLVLNTCVLSE